MRAIYEFFYDMFTDGPLGIFLGSLMLFVIGLLLWVIYSLLYPVVDKWGQTEFESEGVVVSKSYSEGYYYTTYVMSGKVMIPIQNWSPPAWYLHIKVDDGIDSVSVGQEFYNTVSNGDKFTCKCRRGWISGEIYIDEIW